MAQKPRNIPPHAPVQSSGRQADAPDFAGLLKLVAQDRDQQAFIRLFEHFAPRVKSFLIKSGADPETADEMAQETMIAVWNQAQTYNPHFSAPATWIFTIARNKRIDGLRRRANTRFEDADSLPLEDQGPTPRDELAAAEETEILGQAIRNLPPDQADLVKKSYFEDKSHAEIARETGLPLGTVKSRIRLALDRLRNETKVKALCP